MAQTPSLLALVPDAFGGRGGIAQYNRDFLGAVAEDGLASPITVLPRHAPDRFAPRRGIDQLAPRPGRIAYSAAALMTALRRPADIVFCGHLYMAPLAWLIARLKRARLVVQLHGGEAWPRPSRLQHAAVENADLVLCVSRDTRAHVAGWAAVAPERLLVVSNTVGDGFTPGDGTAMRVALGLADERVLLTVGRLDSFQNGYKGHDRVITALPELIAQGHDIVYVIAGEGDDRARLEALAHSTAVAERVRFLGAVAPQDLAQAYRMADLFVMPSTLEGFGIVFLEAMASGTRAIGLAAGGAPDAFADGELGTIVAPEEFPAALARLLTQPKPEPAALAAAVHRRFGRPVFRAQLGRAFARLSGDS
jgi:phosphatidylinositol alpha-1,6-mannosyltransferase